MIKKIGVENFRIFKDFTEFELTGINVLVGPNNSGKSSVIKLISLLKNSFDQFSDLDELKFTGGRHNLGTFDHIINTENENNKIKLVFDIYLDHFDEKFNLELTYIPNGEDGRLVAFKVFNDNRSLFTVLVDLDDGEFVNEGIYQIDLQYLKETINSTADDNQGEDLFFEYTLMGREGEVNVNDKYQTVFKLFENYFSNLLCYFDPGDTRGDWYKVINWMDAILDSWDNPLSDFVVLDDSWYQMELEVPETFMSFLEKKIESEYPEIRDYMDEFINDYKSIYISLSKSNFKRSRELIQSNFKTAVRKLLFTLNRVHHLNVNRGSQKRVLDNLASTAIDEIVKNYNDYGKVHGDTAFLDQAFRILGIEGRIEIDRIEGNNSAVYINDGKRRTPLSDLGFGYSQIIPILLKIINIDSLKSWRWDDLGPYSLKDLERSKLLDMMGEEEVVFLERTSDKELQKKLFLKNLVSQVSKNQQIMDQTFNFSTLIIEEPEANLHPNLQSKLADILVLAHNTFGMRFILETHSEYLIRKLQYLVARGEMKSDSVNIFYFNDDHFVNNREPKIKKIQITNDGNLTDTFGPGFYDEATRLQFELMKLNKEQSN